MTDFADLMRDVAIVLCDKPNEHLSKANELRFGTNGSLSIKIEGPEKGTFYDHEEGVGGGVLDPSSYGFAVGKINGKEYFVMLMNGPSRL